MLMIVWQICGFVGFTDDGGYSYDFDDDDDDDDDNATMVSLHL